MMAKICAVDNCNKYHYSVCSLQYCSNPHFSKGLCNSHYKRKKRNDTKQWATQLLGNKCAKCGAAPNTNRRSNTGLEFDHINPVQRVFRISQRLDLSREKLLKELKKCQLLCEPCHKQKSIQDMVEMRKWDETAITGRINHGTVNAYKNKRCRCQRCKDAWAEYSRNKNWYR